MRGSNRRPRSKYGNDPKTVLEILNRVAREHDDVLDYPEPYALFKAHGENESSD